MDRAVRREFVREGFEGNKISLVVIFRVFKFVAIEGLVGCFLFWGKNESRCVFKFVVGRWGCEYIGGCGVGF